MSSEVKLSEEELILPWKGQETYEILIYIGIWLEDKNLDKSFYFFEIASNQSSLACWHAGKILMKMKRYEEAIAYFEKSMDVVKDHQATLYLIAKSYYLIGETGKCNDFIDKILEINPSNGAAKALQRRIMQS